MSEFIVERGIVIDDAEAALFALRQLVCTTVSGLDIVKKFIVGQKATRFYLDNKASVKMAPERDTIYLWVDTGFTDKCGNPIFISLLESEGGYWGHRVGTSIALAKGIASYFPKNKQFIEKNIVNFRSKYEKKIAERTIRHITNEEKFLIESCNDDAGGGEIARLISNLHLVFEEDVKELVSEEKPNEPEENLSDWSAEEHEITLGILLEKIDEMQVYIKELLSTIENMSAESNEKIVALQKKNEEYEQSFKQIRDFMTNEEAECEEKTRKKEYHKGHELIARRGKVLVLGATEINKTELMGICKAYGFEKNDIDYVLDYSKVVNFAGRITNDGKYCAIIFGACPHKVSESYGWSSLIEKYRNMPEGPVTIDARCNSGKLKVTKDSFKKALFRLCVELE